MTKGAKEILWDTCVVYRWLSRRPTEYVDHIEQYVSDAESDRAKLYISSIALSEIRPSRVQREGATPAQIVAELRGVLTVLDPTPDIMSMAGMMKDNRFLLYEKGSKGEEVTRELSTGDAIHLATALWMRDIAKMTDVEFHTFDDGRHRGPEGRCVPMLSFRGGAKVSSTSL